jgi:hypothetical protein
MNKTLDLGQLEPIMQKVKEYVDALFVNIDAEPLIDVLPLSKGGLGVTTAVAARKMLFGEDQIGSATQPIYMNANEQPTASNANVGSIMKPIYMEKGVFKASTEQFVTESSQPDFSEKIITRASWIDLTSYGSRVTVNSAGTNWKSSGSSATRSFTHTPHTNDISIDDYIIYSIPSDQNNYMIIFTADNKFDISANIKISYSDGQQDSDGNYTLTDITTGDYSNNSYIFNIPGTSEKFLHIIPTSNYDGSFKLDRLYYRSSTVVNSESMLVKGMPLINLGTSFAFGGGLKNSDPNASENNGIGRNALLSNVAGVCNIAIGNESLTKGLYAYRNIAIGTQTLSAIAAGYYNVAVGDMALRDAKYSIRNTAIGSSVLIFSSGQSNTGVGASSMSNLRTGSYNNALGAGALGSIQKGSNNIAIGANSARTVGSYPSTEYNDSIFIGVDAKTPVKEPQTNQIVIGYNAIGHGTNTITLGNDQITAIHSQVSALTALSDKRIKKDITRADLLMCRDAVMNLPVSRYAYENFTGKHLDEHVTGFLADDVEKVFPKSVSKSDRYFPILDENGNKTYEEVEGEQVEKTFLMKDVKDITMTEAVPTLWGALQWALGRIDELSQEVQDLKSVK